MNKHNLQKSHSFEKSTSEQYVHGEANVGTIEIEDTDQFLMQELEEKTKRIEEEFSIEHSKLSSAHSLLMKKHNSLQSDYQAVVAENVLFCSITALLIMN